MDDNREEGEISDEEDVIITQVTHVTRDGLTDGHDERLRGSTGEGVYGGQKVNKSRVGQGQCVRTELPKTPESSKKATSGFIDKMRKKGTPLFSPTFTHNFSYLPKIENDDAADLMNAIDVASIPPPPPPPLPRTPPPSVPLPPPESLPTTDPIPGELTKESAEDISDEFVDTLLEEATKQIAKDLDDMEDKTEVVDMELESSDDGEILDDSDSKIVMTNPPMEDDEEDLDVLELRLAALASYAKSTVQRLEDRNVDEDQSVDELPKPYASTWPRHEYPEYMPSRRGVLDFSERKRKRSGEVDLSRRRYEEERTEREKRKRVEEKLRREEEKRQRLEDAYRREKSLREEEKRERRRLQEVEQKLMELQNIVDPKNMLQKILDLAGHGSKMEQNSLMTIFSNAESIRNESVASGDDVVTSLGDVEPGCHMALAAAAEENRYSKIKEESDVSGSESEAGTVNKAGLTKQSLLSWVERNCMPGDSFYADKTAIWDRVKRDFVVQEGDKGRLFLWLPAVLCQLQWQYRVTKRRGKRNFIGFRLVEESTESWEDLIYDEDPADTVVKKDAIGSLKMPTNQRTACEGPMKVQEMPFEEYMNSISMDMDSDCVEEERLDGSNDFTNFEGDIFEKSMDESTPDHIQEPEKVAAIFPKAAKQNTLQAEHRTGEAAQSEEKSADILVDDSDRQKNVKCDFFLSEGVEEASCEKDVTGSWSGVKIPFIDEEPVGSCQSDKTMVTFVEGRTASLLEKDEFVKFKPFDKMKMKEQMPFIDEDGSEMIVLPDADLGTASATGPETPVTSSSGAVLASDDVDVSVIRSDEVVSTGDQEPAGQLGENRGYLEGHTIERQSGAVAVRDQTSTETQDKVSHGFGEELELSKEGSQIEDSERVNFATVFSDSTLGKTSGQQNEMGTGDVKICEGVVTERDLTPTDSVNALTKLSELRESIPVDGASGDGSAPSTVVEKPCSEDVSRDLHALTPNQKPVVDSETDRAEVNKLMTNSPEHCTFISEMSQEMAEKCSEVDEESATMADMDAAEVSNKTAAGDAEERPVAADNEDEAEDESWLRAELLASVARKRREKYEALWKTESTTASDSTRSGTKNERKTRESERASKNSVSLTNSKPRPARGYGQTDSGSKDSKSLDERRSQVKSQVTKVVRVGAKDRKPGAISRKDRQKKERVGAAPERGSTSSNQGADGAEILKSGSKRKWDESDKKDAGSEEEDESLLRAQLLASVARKRREKYEAEIAVQDAEIKAMTEITERVKSGTKTSSKQPARSRDEESTPRQSSEGARHQPSGLASRQNAISAAENESTVLSKTEKDKESVVNEKRPSDEASMARVETKTGSALSVTSSPRTDSDQSRRLSASVKVQSKEHDVIPVRIIEQDPSFTGFDTNFKKGINKEQISKSVVLTPEVPPPSPMYIKTLNKSEDYGVMDPERGFVMEGEGFVPDPQGQPFQAVGSSIHDVRTSLPEMGISVSGVSGSFPGIVHSVHGMINPFPATLDSIQGPVYSFPEVASSFQEIGDHIPESSVPGMVGFHGGMVSSFPTMFTQAIPTYVQGDQNLVGSITGFETGIAAGSMPHMIPQSEAISFPVCTTNEQPGMLSSQIPMLVTAPGVNQAYNSSSVSLQHIALDQNSTPEPTEAVDESNVTDDNTSGEITVPPTVERRVEVVRNIPTVSNRQVKAAERVVEIVRVSASQEEHGASHFMEEEEEEEQGACQSNIDKAGKGYKPARLTKSQRKKERRKLRQKLKEETSKNRKAVTTEPPIARPIYSVPKVKPVVISLQDDSTDEEEGAGRSQQASSQAGFLSSLDTFLKDVRASVERSKQEKPHPTTPEALKNLGSKYVQEYKELKEEIRKREEKLRAKQPTQRAAEQAARQSVEEARKQVHRLELRVTLQNKMMDQDQQNLATLKSLVAKKRNVVSLAEQKMKQLEDQLLATRRIHKANIEQIDTLNVKCDACEKQIEARYGKLRDLQNEMLDAGRRTYGLHYTPFAQSHLSAPESSLKRGESTANSRLLTSDASAPVANSPKRNSGLPPSSHSKLSMVEGSLEEERSEEKVKHDDFDEEQERIQLEKLHKQYAELIQRHKEKAKAKPQAATLEPEHIETQETMTVNAVQDCQEEPAEIARKRRRFSILDIANESSTRPNLAIRHSPKKESFVKAAQAVGGRSDGEMSSRESSPKPSALPISAFKMPTGQHLANLCKLHKENLQKDAWFNKSQAIPSSSDTPLSCDSNLSVIPGVKYKPQLSSKPGVVSGSNLPPLKAYTSSLLRFKSYRFNPYYRTKAGLNLSSLTFSNKIHPRRMFCRFDLTGTCNDDKCPWQHHSTLSMGSQEVLEDLASYIPEAAGVQPGSSFDVYPKEINNFVTAFRAQNPVPDSQQCVLMVSHVNEATKHVPPHTTFVEARTWRPGQIMPEESDKESIYSFLFDKETDENNTGKIFEDDILSEEDIRYWMLGSDEVQDMESGVQEDKHNVRLWLKLAYKRLHDRKLSPDSNLDQALNVLSRSLEANRTSVELWQHYLAMFSQRNDKAELLMLCRQGLQYAPSYELHWKYLTVLPTFSQKKAHCKKIEEYLTSADCVESAEVKSHHFLEIILYCVQLCILSGRTATAVQILQEKVRSELSWLTLPDLVLLGMCYVHILECRCLPRDFFDDATSVPSHIVNKEPFVISWRSKGDKHLATIRSVLEKCSTHRDAKGNEEALVPLYKTLLQYHICDGRMEALENECKSLQEETQPLCFQKLPLDVASQVYDIERQLQMHGAAMQQAAPHDVQVAYQMACVMLSAGRADGALECLERVPARFFDIADGDSWDPNQLYCKLLRQPLPLECRLPERNKNISEEQIKDQLPYLWASYCLILDLQGFQSDVSQCYEAAVTSLVDVRDLRFVWRCYLRHSHKELVELGKIAQPRKTGQTLQLANRFQHFTTLVKQCLVSMPTKFPIPCNPDSHWLDYSFHCDVIEFYIACLEADDKVKAYEEFVRMMPDNVRLIIRACKCFYSYGAKTLALGASRVALEDHKQCLPLWKLHLLVASDVSSPREVLRLYRRATQAVPHSLWLWTNYLLMEATCGKEENVKQILQKCKDLELNLGDFVATVLK